MMISGLEWISNSGDEAVVIISGGKMNVAVFSNPYTKSIGNVIDDPLHPLDVTGLRVAYGTEVYANRHSGNLSYDCCGILLSKASGIVEVDGIFLEIEDKLPCDLNDGDLIEFSCNRIDLW